MKLIITFHKILFQAPFRIDYTYFSCFVAHSVVIDVKGDG